MGVPIPVYSTSGQLIGYRDSDSGIVSGLSGAPADQGAVTKVEVPVNGWRGAVGSGPGGALAPNEVAPPGAPIGTSYDPARLLVDGLNSATGGARQIAGAAAGGVQTIGSAVGSLGGLGGSTVDTSQIQAALARQAGLADTFAQQAANYNPYAAPTIAAPTPISAGTAEAQQAQAAQIAQTYLAQQQAPITAQQIQAAQAARTVLGPTALAGQTEIGPTALADRSVLAPAAMAQAAQLNLANANQDRAAQMGLVGSLQDTIAGKSPSVAAIMMRNATDNAVANQYALAQAANGMNTGAATRAAMINAAGLNQADIMQHALLRAKEIQDAQQQLGANLGTLANQDIGIAGTQAGLQQQTALANQAATNTAAQAQLSADVQTKLANAGFVNTQNMNQAQLNQAIQLANAGFKNTATTTQAQLDQATAALNAQQQQAAAIANQNANLSAQTTNATLGNQVQLANAAAQNNTAQQNAGYTNAANLQNAQMGTQASIANANNTTSANTASATLGNQAAIANASNQTTTNALNQKAQQDLAANQLTATGQIGQTSVGMADAQAKMAQAEAQKQAALIGGVSSGAAALLSDRTAKTDIRPAEAEIANWTSTLEPSSFRYKDPDTEGAAPGDRYGIMAQDLLKSKVGRSLIRERPDGKLSIDVPQSIGVILATLSAMNKRQEARS